MATADASPTRRAAGELRAYERRVYSQNGEDGILEEILRRLGRSSGGFFVEFGTGDGSECNCARLVIEGGWVGLFMEADATAFAKLGARYATRPGVRCVNALVTSRNVEGLLRDNGVPPIFDVLSIDIDGNDYWVWAAITHWRPRLVVIEYNAEHPPPRAWVMKENPLHVWDGTGYFGASLTSLARLGSTKATPWSARSPPA